MTARELVKILSDYPDLDTEVLIAVVKKGDDTCLAMAEVVKVVATVEFMIGGERLEYVGTVDTSSLH